MGLRADMPVKWTAGNRKLLAIEQDIARRLDGHWQPPQKTPRQALILRLSCTSFYNIYLFIERNFPWKLVL
jgi:hypothetical protein